jgi:hypothetical protein
MNIPLGYTINLPDAIREYETITFLRTPIEKAQCLMRTFFILGNEVSSPDQLIPLTIILLLQSKVSNLATNIDYIKLFTFEENVSQGRVGYILSTIDAAIKYINENFVELSGQSSTSIFCLI